MFKNLSRATLALGAAMALSCVAGCAQQSPPPAPPAAAAVADPTASDLALYQSVVDRIQASYVEPVGEDKLLTNSLKGMLNGLDPHSDYMTESEYEDMLDDNSGEFAGIGAELSREDGRPKIISPIDDTPASRAGLRPGDIIIKIDGKATDGMSLKDVVDALRGAAGSKLEVTIARQDEKPFDVQLVRAIIHVASVKYQLEPHHIGYARVTSFADNTQAELVTAIDAMKRQSGGQLDGFVLDLRNDPGGLLDEAIRVAGDFLDGGVVVSTRGRDEDDNHVYHAPSDGDLMKGVPVVVLINGASASASEIVAGALQDRRRGTLLGTRSFGKGSVQTIIPLDGRGALRLTTALYYTPSGRSIQAKGIEPDMIVEAPQNEINAQAEILHEADLQGAINASDPGKAVSAHPDDSEDGSIDPAIIGTAQDAQLAKALTELGELRERPLAQGTTPAGR